VAASDAEADWLRFYEGIAAARLIVPLAGGGGTGGGEAKLMTLRLEAGEVALAFDTEARFNGFISVPTEFVALTGAALARALAPLELMLALNPTVSPAETVLDPAALKWIAGHAAAEVEGATQQDPTEVRPPAAPPPVLLEALGTRIDEMAGNVAEAWLVTAVASKGREAWLCVVRPSAAAEPLADDIAAELTRIGQIRAARPFGVAVVRDGARLLQAARRFGIGLAGAGA